MGREAVIRVPSLFGGISQQPAHLRFPNQVEDAENSIFSVLDGASKRPGTVFMSELDTLTDGGDYRLHVIDRDGTEQYLVVYGDGDLEVHEIYDETTLVKATVNIDSEAATYLALNSPTSDQLRLVSIKDFTLIVNTTVETGLSDSADYAVELTHKSLATLYTHSTTDGNYQAVDDGNEVTYYQYDPDADEASASTFAFYECGAVSGVQADPASYDDAARDDGTQTIGFARVNMDTTGTSWTTATKTLTKTGAFASYTLEAGDQIYITGGTNVNTGWYTIASRVSDDAITLNDEITSGSTDETDITTDAIGAEVEFTFSGYTFTTGDSMEDVARVFNDALQSAGSKTTDALIAWVSTGANTGNFRITSPWRGAGSAVFAPAASTGDDFTAAGEVLASGTATAGTGNPTRATNPPSNRWVSVAPPNQADALLDATKMPVQLVRSSYTGDGSTPAVFAVDPITWNPRTVGDSVTNPAPSIFTNGNKIADITLWQNRLVFGGQENIVLSQAGDIFNFFLSDDDNIVDSDPIDVAISSDRVALIDFIVPFRDNIVVFTKAGRQFELTKGSEGLTPSSIQIDPSTNYETQSIRPEQSELFLYFLGNRRDASVLYEYFYDDSRVSNSAADITSHTPNLLPTAMRSLTASPNNQMVFAIPADCDKLYMNRSHWNGNQKVQNAWTRYTFDSSYNLLDCASLRNDLYILVWDGTQIVIERMPVIRQTLL